MPARPLVVARDAFSVDTLLRRAMAVFVGADLAVFLGVAFFGRSGTAGGGHSPVVAWLSGLQLSLIGWLAIAMALVMGLHRAARYQRWQRAGWAGMGLACLALAAEQSLQVRTLLPLPDPIAGPPVAIGLVLIAGILGGMVVLGLMVPQLMGSQQAMRLFAFACGMVGLSQVDGAFGLVQRAGLALPWQRLATLASQWFVLMAEVGFIMALLALLATHVGRMATSSVVPTRVANGTWLNH
jgi:hypothetical protein